MTLSCNCEIERNYTIVQRKNTTVQQKLKKLVVSTCKDLKSDKLVLHFCLKVYHENEELITFTQL